MMTFYAVLFVIALALFAGLIYYSWPRTLLPYEKLQQVKRRPF